MGSVIRLGATEPDTSAGVFGPEVLPTGLPSMVRVPFRLGEHALGVVASSASLPARSAPVLEALVRGEVRAGTRRARDPHPRRLSTAKPRVMTPRVRLRSGLSA